MNYVETSAVMESPEAANAYLESLTAQAGFMFGYVDAKLQVVSIHQQRESSLKENQQSISLVFANPAKREYQRDLEALATVIWPHP